jgi:serine/threonine protein kinase
MDSGALAEAYAVTELLGVGSSAEVWKCSHRGTNRPFAAKVHKKSAVSELGSKEFRSEVAIMGRLRHPNVIQLEEVLEDDTAVYAVMELAQGGSLQGVLSRPLLYTERLAAELLFNAFSAVDYLHRHGIAHCDIKPENLLLKHPLPNDSIQLTRWTHLLTAVKLADFGFARHVGEEDALTDCCGTPYYIAPEVLEAGYYKTGRPYGRSCDVWSLAVTGFVAITGTQPFHGHRKGALFAAIVKGDWAFPGSCTLSEVARDFFRSLITRRSKRLTASEALEHPWIVNRSSQPPSPASNSPGLLMVQTPPGGSSEDIPSPQHIWGPSPTRNPLAVHIPAVYSPLSPEGPRRRDSLPRLTPMVRQQTRVDIKADSAVRETQMVAVVLQTAAELSPTPSPSAAPPAVAVADSVTNLTWGWPTVRCGAF